MLERSPRGFAPSFEMIGIQLIFTKVDKPRMNQYTGRIPSPGHSSSYNVDYPTEPSNNYETNSVIN